MWAADGRLRAEWNRGAYFVAFHHKSLTGEVIDPLALVPERYRHGADRPRKPNSPERERQETQASITLLGQALGDW